MIVNQFWYDLNTDVNGEIELCLLRVLSIRSFLSHGYTVHFWSYQTVTNEIDHPNFKWMDAREIISEKEFLSRPVTLHRPGQGEVMKKKVNIAHFSDLFRALLLYKQGGWWFDTDAYCLNKLPQLKEKDRGVILCSLPIKRTGARIVKRKGADFSNSTIYAEKGHQLMKEMAKRVKGTFGKPLAQGFVEPMYVCYEAVEEGGYQASIRPPLTFIPLCWWRTKLYYHENDGLRKRSSFGEHIPTAKTIIKHSSAVNFYNGTFQYLLESKKNAAHTLFDLICEKTGMEIDLSRIYFDGSNYHVMKDEKRRRT